MVTFKIFMQNNYNKEVEGLTLFMYLCHKQPKGTFYFRHMQQLTKGESYGLIVSSFLLSALCW
jgi:hypothetical protein